MANKATPINFLALNHDVTQHIKSVNAPNRELESPVSSWNCDAQHLSVAAIMLPNKSTCKKLPETPNPGQRLPQPKIRIPRSQKRTPGHEKDFHPRTEMLGHEHGSPALALSGSPVQESCKCSNCPEDFSLE